MIQRFGRLSQEFPKRAAHIHCPLTHIPTPAGPPSHSFPHMPQWRGSTASSASQPSPALSLLQSANPALQVPDSHDPLTHAAVMLTVEHTLPHPPQFIRSVLSLTQLMPHHSWPL